MVILCRKQTKLRVQQDTVLKKTTRSRPGSVDGGEGSGCLAAAGHLPASVRRKLNGVPLPQAGSFTTCYACAKLVSVTNYPIPTLIRKFYKMSTCSENDIILRYYVTQVIILRICYSLSMCSFNCFQLQ